MKLVKRVDLGTTVETQAWIKVENPDLTMEAAVIKLEELGNSIIEVKEETREILVVDSINNPEEEVWACDYCGAYSRHYEVVEDHEKTEHLGE